MKSRTDTKRTAIKIISVLIAFSVLVPFIFTACNVFHECDEGECLVCLKISSLTLSLKKITLFLAAFLSALALLTYISVFTPGISGQESAGISPVGLKVKMNN